MVLKKLCKSFLEGMNITSKVDSVQANIINCRAKTTGANQRSSRFYNWTLHMETGARLHNRRINATVRTQDGQWGQKSGRSLLLNVIKLTNTRKT